MTLQDALSYLLLVLLGPLVVLCVALAATRVLFGKECALTLHARVLGCETNLVVTPKSRK